MTVDLLATFSPKSTLIGTGSGVFAGYAAGRAIKIAVDIVKWVIAIFVGIEISLHEMGLITIHFNEVKELLANLSVGGSGINAVITTLTDFIFSFVPMAGGFGVGFYAGYKKMIV